MIIIIMQGMAAVCKDETFWHQVYQLAATKGKDKALSYISTLPKITTKEKKELIGCANFLEEYKREGVVIIRSAISQEKVKESVNEIWNRIIGLPWKDEYKKQWQELYESFKDDFWRDTTPEECELVKSIYPMTGGFGALTLPPAFHHQTQWDIRQNPLLVDIAKALLGVDKVMTSLDRISFKFTGQGETEFTHWDSDPFNWQNEEYEGMQGIVALSNTSFYAVPQTHTDIFRKEFITKYPESKRSDQYYVTSKHDPMELQSKVKEYKLNPGDWIIWSNRLLHEARINKSKKIRYAYFISYFPYNNPGSAVSTYYKNKKQDFIEDRIKSYETGTNPLAFPSGTPISLYARNHLMYYPEVLNEFCNRFTSGAEEYKYKSGKKKDQVVVLPKFSSKDVTYKAPILTELGRELLGYGY